MFCQKCGAEHDANFCPNCGKPVSAIDNAIYKVDGQGGRKLNVKGRNIAMLLIAFAFLCVCAMVAIIVWSKSEEPTINQIQPEVVAGITLEEFNKVEMGISYEQVVAIIGSSGEVMADSEIGDIRTTMYIWYGVDGISNASVTFQNDEMVMKVQAGLK